MSSLISDSVVNSSLCVKYMMVVNGIAHSLHCVHGTFLKWHAHYTVACSLHCVHFIPKVSCHFLEVARSLYCVHDIFIHSRREWLGRHWVKVTLYFHLRKQIAKRLHHGLSKMILVRLTSENSKKISVSIYFLCLSQISRGFKVFIQNSRLFPGFKEPK